MKKIITIAIILLIAGLIGFKLFTNKKAIKAKEEIKVEIKNVAVTVRDVVRGELSDNLAFTGVFDPYKEMTVMCETNGKVTKIGVEEGDYVGVGKLIAQTDVTIMQANKDATEALVQKLEKDVQRSENLMKSRATTEVQLQDVKYQLQTAQSNFAVINKQIQNATITAPIAGTITKRYFENGSVLAPETPVCSITDISRLKLRINVPENDIVKYKTGDKITIKTDVYPNQNFTGTISVVGVKSLNSRMFPVEVVVQNDPKVPLKAGMYGRTLLAKDKIKDAIIIDRQALIGSIQNPQVFVLENNRAYLRKITLGEVEGTRIQVISGLNAGEKVIVTGQINLENGNVVTVTNSKY